MFVKGVVNQEAQKEIQFPEVLHCVFCGAKGLFMDCLIKNTSAHIVVSKKCFLKIIYWFYGIYTKVLLVSDFADSLFSTCSIVVICCHCKSRMRRFLSKKKSLAWLCIKNFHSVPTCVHERVLFSTPPHFSNAFLQCMI